MGSGTGDNLFGSQFIQRESGLQGTQEIISDRNDAEIETGDSQSAQKGFLDTVPDPRVRDIGHDLVDLFFILIDDHDVVSQLVKLHRAVVAIPSGTDDQYAFRHCQYLQTMMFLTHRYFFHRHHAAIDVYC